MTLQTIVASLKNIGSAEPENEAYIILEHLFGTDYATILLDKEKDYEDEKILPIIEKRKEKIPLQYIIGKWCFMGEDFFVSPDCLIPRNDTEILVEKALKLLKKGGNVADLCTGSGCIGISMLKFRDDIEKMCLVDISNGALNMAKKNAENLGVYDRCNFINGDICTLEINDKFDMIVSNPPYIPTDDINFLSDEVKKEPFIALDGGKDGYDFIKILAKRYLSMLNDGGYMLIEFGYDQGDGVSKIFEKEKKNGTLSDFEIIKDYSKNDRLVVIKK